MRETVSNRVMLSDTTDRESSSAFCGQSRDHQKGMGLLVFRFIFIDILVFLCFGFVSECNYCTSRLHSKHDVN